MEDKRIPIGQAGLIVLLGAGEQASFTFDNFVVRELPITDHSLTAAHFVVYAEVHAEAGNLEEALRYFEQAQLLDPSYEVSAYSLNTICWFGGLWGYAGDVLEICERAVTLAPTNGGIRDSRGVARALTGDIEGAIEDFIYFVAWGEAEGIDSVSIERREAWIRDLREGIDPFTPEMLDILKVE
jgi:tetratricopeptide (TPR) repeat protein